MTIKDIARICGVGVSTVSRAINNHPDINEETKAQIMQVIKENNFVPNNSARNLKRLGSKTIAVLIKGITNPFFSKMIKVFEREIKEQKYSFELQRVDDSEDEVDVAIQLIKEKKVKGIIFLGGYFSHSKEKLNQIGVPYVLCTTGVIGDNISVSSVNVDDYKESYKIVDYLLNIGHQKIAIISNGEKDVSIGRLRLEGYRKALMDHKMKVDHDLELEIPFGVETYSLDAGYIATKELLDSGKDFSAIYAISDRMAIGACRAIFDAGKRVPEDYSVAGYDGLDFGQYYNPSITTIKQPVEDMALSTINILFDMIKKKKPPRSQVFEGELIVGKSTGKI